MRTEDGGRCSNMLTQDGEGACLKVFQTAEKMVRRASPISTDSCEAALSITLPDHLSTDVVRGANLRVGLEPQSNDMTLDIW